MNSSDKGVSSTVHHTHGNRNDDKDYSLIICHPNIHGLKGKINKFMLSLVSERPHLICLSERHLKYNEIDFAHIPTYKLGAKYCRTSLKCGGVCIYIHKNIKYSNINLLKFCKEQDLEIAAVKLKFAIKNVIVLCAYGAPMGDLEYFLKQLDSLINSLHNPKTGFILCGDLNINYIGINNKKTQLENLLNMFNLIGTVHFPTRITNTSFCTIDIIFVDNRSSYTIKPCINVLSDHNAQLLSLNDLAKPISINKPIYIRNIKKHTTAEFQSLLSWEQWEDVFGISNVNIRFNNFLNTYL
jgi:exonuclease III